jgi:predicted RNA-binding Zn ribbon-like protein
VDNADYLDVALRLANITSVDESTLAEALHDEPWWATRLTPADVRALRPVALGLRRALAAAVAADASGVLTETNALLAAHPLRPRLSGHGEGPGEHWHVHVADPDEPPAGEVAAAASWGLAQAVVQHGLTRFGQCAAPDCGKYFMDTSTNRAKRFCSARCANRVHVAAFRSRQRD